MLRSSTLFLLQRAHRSFQSASAYRIVMSSISMSPGLGSVLWTEANIQVLDGRGVSTPLRMQLAGLPYPLLHRTSFYNEKSFPCTAGRFLFDEEKALQKILRSGSSGCCNIYSPSWDRTFISTNSKTNGTINSSPFGRITWRILVPVGYVTSTILTTTKASSAGITFGFADTIVKSPPIS